MIEREFEALLTTYLDGNIADDELTEFKQAIQDKSKYRERFQAEFRLQTLMHISALTRRELKGLSVGRGTPSGRKRAIGLWTTVIALAACLLVGTLLVVGLWHEPVDRQQALGRFLQISGSTRMVAQGDRGRLFVNDGQTIQDGDRIACDPDMQTLVELMDGTLLFLEGESTITITKNQAKYVEIFVEKGKVLLEVAERGPNEHRLVAKTHQATATALGTLFSIEVQPTWTRADVYEGLVHFRQEQTGDAVEVARDQYAEIWGDGFLQVRDLSNRGSGLSSPQMILSPTDDVYLHEGRRVDDLYLCVEGGRRFVHLRFDVPNTEIIQTARLQLTQMRDAGRGTLHFYQGSHANWTEQDQSVTGAPELLREIARHTGVVGFGQRVEVDVLDLIKEAGSYTIIVTLDSLGTDDIAFGSKESPVGPKLIINQQWRTRSLQAGDPHSRDRTVIAEGLAQSSRHAILAPTDDACLEDGERVNRSYLHVEEGRRISFCKFEVPDRGIIQEARLQLTQCRDTGSGTVCFYEGSHSNWTERNLRAEHAPEPRREIARYTGFVGPFDTVNVDVSDLITGPGVYTIVMTLDAGGIDDIAFGSRESSMGPKLIVKWQ